MPEKAAFFHFYSAFSFIPREISGLEELAVSGEQSTLKGAFDSLQSEAVSLLPQLEAYRTEVRHWRF
jgi:hypothetical protein